MDKQNVEELRQELKNLDWSKYARYQSMTAEEMIVCDEKVDCCKDFTTKDIYDIVTGKEELEEITEEGVNNEVIKISNKEASRAIETLLNYVSQSSEFCEEDFNKIKDLSERLEKISRFP